MRYLYSSIVLTAISALLVWLPNTNTLLDPWRVFASIITGVFAAMTFADYLHNRE